MYRVWVTGIWALMAACGGTGVVADEAATGGQRPGGASASPVDTAWTAGIVHVESERSRPAVQRDVRSARHEGYDRVVFDFGAEGLPGYHLEYVDHPVRHCASGEPIEIAGDGFLRVRLEPARAHTDVGDPSVTERVQQLEFPVLRELVLVCDFEGQVEWVLGVDAPNRYRVQELSGPDRLVVDVRHR